MSMEDHEAPPLIPLPHAKRAIAVIISNFRPNKVEIRAKIGWTVLEKKELVRFVLSPR
jgi:hypothetical protein